MWTRILDRMLRDLFTEGGFALTYPDGTTRHYGPATEVSSHMILTDPALPKRLVLNTDLALGEGYMEGTLRFADDDLDAFLMLALQNAAAKDGMWWRKWSMAWQNLRRRVDQHNPLHRARENVAHHYDLSTELYDLFLDADRQYSCAYFTEPEMSLEAAQEAKTHHIARKLCLSPGQHVFEIGCGWGGLALTLARDYGVEVTGVTLSTEQHRIACARAEAEGLSDKVRFELRDYRDVTGQFDRIVSVGMFEHVGVPHYGEFFGQIRDRLAPDGVALLHTIGRARPPGATSPWILKYIFPGGYCPSMSEMTAAMEWSGLYPTDLEVWRLHYAETLRHWFDRFVAQEDKARALYDDRFCRMWRYYLKACEHTFRYNRQCVFQLQMTRDVSAAPITRDYMYGVDRA